MKEEGLNMNNKGKYGYLAKNTLLFTISSFGSKILTFLLVPLYTAILSTSDYGTADLISTTATLLIYIFTINIADSVMRFTIDKNKKDGVFSYSIKILLLGSIMLMLFLVPFAFENILEWNRYCYVFLFINFFLVASNQILINYLRGIDKIKEVAVAGILTTVFTIVSNIVLLVLFNWGLLGYLISTVVGVTISSLYVCLCIRNDIGKLLFEQSSLQTRKEMRQYSIPLIFNGIAWWINNSLDKYFILSICGTATNGIYAVASKIPAILTVFQQIFSQAWNLSAIKEFDPDDKDGFFGNTYTMYNAGLVLACSILIYFNIPLAKVLFSKDFFVAWKSSSVLLVSVLFSALSGFVGCVFTAVKNSKVFAVSTITAAIINTVLNALLIPEYQEFGAAIATAVSFYVIWAIRYICAKKYIRWKINLMRDILSYLLLAVQIIIERFLPTVWLYEAIIVLIIFILYNKELKKINRFIIRFINKKVR